MDHYLQQGVSDIGKQYFNTLAENTILWNIWFTVSKRTSVKFRFFSSFGNNFCPKSQLHLLQR